MSAEAIVRFVEDGPKLKKNRWIQRATEAVSVTKDLSKPEPEFVFLKSNVLLLVKVTVRT
jgi:hypothetical protein